MLFHPKMCPSSLENRTCFDVNCRFPHIKGTKRFPPSKPELEVGNSLRTVEQSGLNATSTHSKTNNVQNTYKSKNVPSSSAVSYAEALKSIPRTQPSHRVDISTAPLNSDFEKLSKDSFLGIIGLLKKELMQAIETKIALTISQPQIMQPRAQPQNFQQIPQTLQQIHQAPTYKMPPLPKNHGIQACQNPMQIFPTQMMTPPNAQINQVTPFQIHSATVPPQFNQLHMIQSEPFPCSM